MATEQPYRVYTYTLTKRRDAGGDYVVRCYERGKRFPMGDYFTSDWVDAVNTKRE